MKHRSRALWAALGVCAVTAAAPAVASAEPTVAKLRVESDDRALSPGVNYVNDTARLATAPSQCGGSGQTKTVEGPSAIGLVDYAQETSSLLRPFYVSDKFDFGLIVCRIGDRGAFNANEAWLYRVDHKSPPVGGDQYRLSRGDEVLWYFANFETGENTGDELDLRAPARVKPGVPFTVSTVAYDFEGNARPAAGATVSGDSKSVTGPDGRAKVVLTGEGTKRLRATRGNDIATAPTPVCVNENLERCPAQRTELIVGTNGADSIVGTATPDSVVSRGGDDRIDVRNGNSDGVRCGVGNDSVLASSNDRVAPDCERLNGRLR